MKVTRNVCRLSLPGLLGLAGLNCFAELTPQQLLERGENRAFWTNDYDGAIADFTLVIAAKYNLGETYTERGRAYLGKTNYDDALSDYGRAIQADQKNWSLYGPRFDGT